MTVRRLLVATDFSVRSDRAVRRAALISRQLHAPITLLHVVDADMTERLIESEHHTAAELLAEMAETLREHDDIDADWMIRVDDAHAGIQTAAVELAADLIIIGPHRPRLRDIFVGTTAERIVQSSTFPLLIAIEPPAGKHRKTLLAVDFDHASKAAALKALAMGIFDHTQVTVMHAYDAPAEGLMQRAMMDPDEVTHYVKSEGVTARQDLKALLADLGLPRTSQTVASVKGTPSRTIFESAQQTDSDLIVLGTNQRAGLERALIGSVTADVIRDAQRDVLIIPIEDSSESED